MRPSPAPLAEAGLVDEPMGLRGLLVLLSRAVIILGGTLLAYALVPIEATWGPAVVATFATIGLLGIFVVFFRQFGKIERSANPGRAAIEALFLVLGTFVTLFAFLYVALSAYTPEAFSQEVDKVDGIYFSVTVLSTVGFGDLVAVTREAKILVTLQMVLDVVLVGAAVKLLGLQAKSARERRHSHGAVEHHRKGDA
jgi:voltage-gated potassium channel